MGSIDRKYFDDIYATSGDPWDFATSWYEARKYALTMAALPDKRYSNAFEPGCSIGVLTAHLALRSDHVLATDIVDIALDQVRLRTAALGNVEVRRLAIPEEWPSDRFDLIVLSEVAYYFDAQTLDEVVNPSGLHEHRGPSRGRALVWADQLSAGRPRGAPAIR